MPKARNNFLVGLLTVTALASLGALAAGAFFLIRPTPAAFVLQTANSGFSALAFSPDGTRLLAAGWKYPAQVWDLTTKTRLLELPLKGSVFEAEFAPDGRTFALGKEDSTVTRWNLAGERRNPVGYHHSYISGLAYSPDGKWLATSGHSDGTTRLRDAKTGAKVRDLTGHSLWAGAVAFSPDSRLVASCDANSLLLWEVATGQRVRRLLTRQPMHFVAFSPDGKTLIGGGSYGFLMRWDAATGKALPGPSPGLGYVSDALFTPDGRYIVAQANERILLLEAATGRTVSTLFGERWQERIPLWLRQKIPALQPPTAPPLLSMALSADGKRLAYATSTELRVMPLNLR